MSAEVAETTLCRVCDHDDSVWVTNVRGRIADREFRIRRCRNCRFLFISDPWLEYEEIYSEDYYRGRGADTKLNYVEEAENPLRTVRKYEWRGIDARVRDIATVGPGTRWLDYGCGTGGLVNYLRARGVDAVGFEQGWCVPRLRAAAVPIVDEGQFAELAGIFDVITGIEVIEHTIDPIGTLREIHALLRPGGTLFLTTGNAAPFAERLSDWRYMTPEVHISFFEPATLAYALEKAGFKVEYPGFGPGWPDMLRYKVLMSLHRKWASPAESVVPWSVLGRVLDKRVKLSAQPFGRA